EQALTFVRNDHARAGPTRDVPRHLLTEMVDVDHRRLHARLGKAVERAVEQPPAGYADQRLRQRFGDRSHPQADPGREQHGRLRHMRAHAPTPSKMPKPRWSARSSARTGWASERAR